MHLLFQSSAGIKLLNYSQIGQFHITDDEIIFKLQGVIGVDAN